MPVFPLLRPIVPVAVLETAEVIWEVPPLLISKPAGETGIPPVQLLAVDQLPVPVLFHVLSARAVAGSRWQLGRWIGSGCDIS